MPFLDSAAFTSLPAFPPRRFLVRLPRLQPSNPTNNAPLSASYLYLDLPSTTAVH
jgi:hypothetical protein